MRCFTYKFKVGAKGLERKGRLVWWGILMIMLGVAFWRFFLPHGSNVTLEKTSSTREIIVYIAGAVEKPGLVHLPVDARLNDAIKQVKLLPEANVEVLNLAEKLKDGQKITIPSITTAISDQQNTALNPSAPNAISGAGTPSSGPAANSNGKVNINTAGISELDLLPGIGSALAERIIQYRNEHGAFANPEDLKKVSGIGEKTYEKMAPMLSVGP
jgi:competence protein ComEA